MKFLPVLTKTEDLYSAFLEILWLRGKPTKLISKQLMAEKPSILKPMKYKYYKSYIFIRKVHVKFSGCDIKFYFQHVKSIRLQHQRSIKNLFFRTVPNMNLNMCSPNEFVRLYTHKLDIWMGDMCARFPYKIYLEKWHNIHLYKMERKNNSRKYKKALNFYVCRKKFSTYFKFKPQHFWFPSTSYGNIFNIFMTFICYHLCFLM